MTNIKTGIFFFGLFFTLILQAQESYRDSKCIDVEHFINKLMVQLSLEEKVSLLSGMGTSRSEFGDQGVPVFGIKGIPDKGIPDFIMGHGITGVRTGRDMNTHSTFFCTPIALACSWDIDLYGQVGEAIAKEMRGLGQDLNLGPTINIIRHPLGGRNWECLSEDPWLTSCFIVPYVKAMQSNGIICGPKHFVANNQEHNRFNINNVIDERTLREIYLPAFKAAITEGGALNIMCAYNRLNGVFMCQNKHLLTDVLRKEWGFSGFILSDFSNGLRSTLGGICAGLNVEMPGPEFYGEKLLEEVNNGAVSTDQVDTMLYYVFKTMHSVDVFNRPRREHEELVHCPKHQELAAEVARKTPVLLKNENHMLPVDTCKVRSIAVIGPNAKKFETVPVTDKDYAYYLQGGGSGRTYYFPEAVIDPYTGLNKQIGKNITLTYAPGCQTPNIYRRNKLSEENKTDERLIRNAVLIAEKADLVVLFVGLSGFNESEGWDRESAGLPGFQERLIQEVSLSNPMTIVVLIAGSYVDVSPWINQVKALLYVPYCGEKIGDGIADILLGDVSPSGKLSFSWPKSAEDYPDGSIFTGAPYSESRQSNVYSEGIYVGYRWFDRQNITVQYPFGFGLSYSEFEYRNLVVEERGDFSADVHLSIKNTGNVKASEICQLYVHDVQSTVDRPLQELKGFVKVDLQPGEEQSVSIHLNKDAFSFFHPEQKEWVAEQGEFEIRVGPNSRDLPLKKVIKF